MGFSVAVSDMLTSLQDKPLIGHNLMYDLLYFYNQFLGPLPTTYLDFISSINKLFPKIYDTKVCAYRNQTIFPKSVLADIYEKTEKDELLCDLVKFKFGD